MGVPVVVDWDAESAGVRLLDQTRLPEHQETLVLTDAEQVAEAIVSLRVRGAPAIGIAAAMGAVIGLERFSLARPSATLRAIREEWARVRALLLETRPTGRNLAQALNRLDAVVVAADLSAGVPRLLERLRREATAVRDDDREQCRRIGEAGLTLLPAGDPVGILTHCNAGALATGGIGTALATVYAMSAAGRAPRVFACETRPVLQGARLTAWELHQADIEVTVMTDSMAGAKLASGEIGLVIVGADAIAHNGDTANKIGTYALSILARHHGVPFYVAAPRTTFEPAYADGTAIPIEERDPRELVNGLGRTVVPRDVDVWNPAFDVTPAHLITAFITDAGVLRPPYEASLQRLLETDPGG